MLNQLNRRYYQQYTTFLSVINRATIVPREQNKTKQIKIISQAHSCFKTRGYAELTVNNHYDKTTHSKQKTSGNIDE